jgi:hypothetical protein
MPREQCTPLHPPIPRVVHQRHRPSRFTQSQPRQPRHDPSHMRPSHARLLAPHLRRRALRPGKRTLRIHPPNRRQELQFATLAGCAHAPSGVFHRGQCLNHAIDIDRAERRCSEKKQPREAHHSKSLFQAHVDWTAVNPNASRRRFLRTRAPFFPQRRAASANETPSRFATRSM